MSAAFVLLTALSLAIGWGIRGNFGHEFGAMIPGALAAMAAVLLSGREDWRRRIAYFGFFGALGWSFGGSMSYMQVIGYTHSGHSVSVLYGFACLFVIGFLWGGLGGAGTALPAALDRERLTEFFAPLSLVFAAWLLEEIVEVRVIAVDPAFRHQDPLYWYDTDWLAAALAGLVALGWALCRRRWDTATSLIFHLAVGWWLGFLLLVNVLGWRMTPPRGDNWAGCVGMMAALWVWAGRNRLPAVLVSSLVAGFIGGFGFATGQLLKLLGLTTGWHTNWHSVLEQTYGLINGLGIALAVGLLVKRAPPVTDDPPRRRWTEVYAVFFVLVGITFLNLRKNPGDWVKAKAFPPALYGWPLTVWFHLAYGMLGLVVLALLVRQLRRPSALLPERWLGRGLLLYLVFLWWMVVGNFERAVVSFAPERLVTEGVIFANAVVCSWLVLAGRPVASAAPAARSTLAGLWRRVLALGLAGSVLSVLVDWGVTRGVYGDRQGPGADRHIRFGPQATATRNPPRPGMPHP